jgi:hypothetical protein
MSESSKFALGQAKELEKALRDQVLFEQAKMEVRPRFLDPHSRRPLQYARLRTQGDAYGPHCTDREYTCRVLLRVHTHVPLLRPALLSLVWMCRSCSTRTLYAG